MNDSKKTLELDEILRRASLYAVSACGKARICSLVPSNDLPEVVERLEFTNQATKLMGEYRYSGIVGFDDISSILDKARTGATLGMGELLSVASVLRSARVVKASLEPFPSEVDKIKDVAFRIFANKSLEDDIYRDVLSETEINDTASDALKDVRYKLRRAKTKLIEKLSSFTRSNVYSKFLQDNLYTMRGGRYVLPVKNECRNDVPGLLHDQSATGATAYIEPFEVVTMNNDIVKLEGEERQEIERILQVFSARVLAEIDNLFDALERLTFLDVCFALADYSIAINGILPEVNFAKEVVLLGARHPLIEPSSVVPIDITVGTDGKTILLISGPNTGGKTVSLKTVGLFSYMMSVGILLPCRVGSKMAIFDKIFCDIGDEQNISMNLSTFSSHVKNLKDITESFTNDSLILLDEIGSSTAPDEGSAMAIGVLEYIAETSAKAIVTTHYPELKEYAMSSDKILNAGMQFDSETLKPTYKLLLGYPGSSNALETAVSIGLLPKIIDTAKTYLGSNDENNYETVLKSAFAIKSKAEKDLEEANKARIEAERKLEKISSDEKKLSEALDRINTNAKAETRKIVTRIADKANDILEEIKAELKEADEKALLQAKKDLKRIEDLLYDNGDEVHSSLYEELSAKDMKVGMKVIVKSFGLEGVIIKLRPERGSAEIDCSGRVITVKISDLAKPVIIEKNNDNVQQKAVADSPSASVKEIMVLGQTVIDAWDEIEPILDNSSRLGLVGLRIVHGKGTGVLGKGIQSRLQKHPAVKSFRYGGYGEGDNGVTIVEIRRV